MPPPSALGVALRAAAAAKPVMVVDVQPRPRFQLRARTRVQNIAVWRDGRVRVAVNAKVYKAADPKLWAILGPKAAVEVTESGLEITLPYGATLRRVDLGDLPGVTVARLYQRRDPLGVLPRKRIDLTKLDGLVS